MLPLSDLALVTIDLVEPSARAGLHECTEIGTRLLLAELTGHFH